MIFTKTIVNTYGATQVGIERKIRKTDPITIIKYEGNIFEANWDELINLSLYYYYTQVETNFKSTQSDDIDYFNRNCITCNFNEENIFAAIIGKIEPGFDCIYLNELDIHIAKEFKDKKKNILFYAEDKPCIRDIILISYLLENNLLQKYKVSREYNFEPISKFEIGELNSTDVPHKKLTLVDKLREMIHL